MVRCEGLAANFLIGCPIQPREYSRLRRVVLKIIPSSASLYLVLCSFYTFSQSPCSIVIMLGVGNYIVKTEAVNKLTQNVKDFDLSEKFNRENDEVRRRANGQNQFWREKFFLETCQAPLEKLVHTRSYFILLGLSVLLPTFFWGFQISFND